MADIVEYPIDLVLRLGLNSRCTSVAYADDLAVVITAEYSLKLNKKANAWD